VQKQLLIEVSCRETRWCCNKQSVNLWRATGATCTNTPWVARGQDLYATPYVTSLGRLRYVGRPSKMLLYFLIYATSYLPEGRAAPRQKYRCITGLVPCRSDKILSKFYPLRHLTHPSLIFTGGGVKKYKIWYRFSTQVAFEALWFQNGTTYWKHWMSHNTVWREAEAGRVF